MHSALCDHSCALLRIFLVLQLSYNAAIAFPSVSLSHLNAAILTKRIKL